MFMITKLLASWILTQQVGAPTMDPDLTWKTLKTEHFYIHYPTILEKYGQRIAVRAEDLYETKTKTFRWEPDQPIHVVLSDPSDSPNGLAIPLPYNTIYLYGSPPLDETALDDYDDWFATLFAHEFTHTIHLDMARGINKPLRWIFGRFWLPNAPQQQWAHEGIAIFYETKQTTRGRGRSSMISAFLRTVSLQNEFAGIDRATYWNDTYPYGNAAYWYGIGFFEYLDRTYGEQKVIDWTHSTASNPIPGFMNFKTDAVFGKSFHRLWEEWKSEQQSKWKTFAESYPTSFRTLPLQVDGQDFNLSGLGSWDESTKTLYAPVKADRDYQIMAFQFDELGKITSSKKIKSGTAGRVHSGKGYLLYASPQSKDSYSSYHDLFLYDLAKEKEIRLTRHLRLRDGVIGADALYAVRTDQFESSLVRIPWAKIEGVISTEEPLSAKSDLEVLYNAEGLNSLAKPSLSPNGRLLAFSMKRENKNRDLYLLDLQSRSVSALTNDDYDDYHPVFLNDEQIIYATDAFFKNSKEQISNIYRIDIQTRETQALTECVTACSLPTLMGSRLAVGELSPRGYVLKLVSSLQSLGAQSASGKIYGEAKTYPAKAPTPAGGYQFGSALAPRFLAPLFLYTESDSLLGAQTGARDPLGFHQWTLFGFYLFGAGSPGAALSYSYKGISDFTFFAGGYAGIYNYGRVMWVPSGTANTYTLDADDYYERIYGGQAGVAHQIRTQNGPTGWNLSLAGFYEYRTNLHSQPAGLLTGKSNGVQLSPEMGTQWGGRFNLGWASDYEAYVDGIGPHQGHAVSLSTEYTPQVAGSDFQTLTTILSAKNFFHLGGDHAFATKLVGGLQWLDPQYQRSFLLGGSLGENPFSSMNRRSYSLRGLPQSNLKGEGLFLASLEYRFPLLKSMPGFGTAPLWFKNLHSAVFTDIGETFQIQDVSMASENYAFNPTTNSYSYSLGQRVVGPGTVRDLKDARPSASVGVELRSDISVTYAPPLQYRLGYAYLLFRQGDNLAKERQDEFYFQLGSSF